MGFNENNITGLDLISYSDFEGILRAVIPVAMYIIVTLSFFAVCLAIVPPIPSISSSGCAVTPTQAASNSGLVVDIINRSLFS